MGRLRANKNGENMLAGLLLILIGIVFAYFGIGGKGKLSGSSGGFSFVLSAGGGILLIVVGVLLLSLP